MTVTRVAPQKFELSVKSVVDLLSDATAGTPRKMTHSIL